MVIATKPHEGSIIGHLGRLCSHHNIDATANTLIDLHDFLANDLGQIEQALIDISIPEDRVGKSARHLLNLEGKRLRPLCVALASRTGQGFNEAALNIGVAVELVHSATLLHDDVVDLGTTRRNQPSARVIYGNAASIFAGDWLLVEALRRVVASKIEGAVEEVLGVIERMIAAEAAQLESRGNINLDLDHYFEVIEGKTAVLFRWAMSAGGRAGQQSKDSCEALMNYGHNLGLAFQIVDDTLDLVGNEGLTGKALFTDLREGKMTYPLIVGAQRDPNLIELLRELLKTYASEELPLDLQKNILEIVIKTEAVEASKTLAKELSQKAKESLQALAPSAARSALEVVSEAALHRQH